MKYNSKLILIFIIMNVYNQKMNSQNIDCYVLPDPIQYSASPIPCFNVDSIYENCIPVYLNVNIHFFVNDDCTGNVSLPQDGTKVTQEGATGWANYMLYIANEELAHNTAQLNPKGYNTPSQAAHCNPVRWFLSGVYFHCDNTNKFNGYDLNLLRNKYAVNPNSELNVFIASYNHSHGSGVAFLGGSISSINRFDWGILNHELAHNLVLYHSFENDGCDDTPMLTFNWDKNCDGTIGTDEMNLKCFGLEPPNSPNCNLEPACPNYPCCDSGWINNNIMGYNNPNGAWSACQIAKVLGHISRYKCEFIAQIGGNCPPLSSFITRLPKDLIKPKHCTYCFDIGASTGYNKYKIEIYDNINPTNPILIKTTHWLSGLAQKYCITGNLQSGWQDDMQSNHPYLIKLIVKNDCSENEKSEPFSLPIRDCTITGDHPNNELKFAISPNPATDNLTIQYELNEESQVKILLTHQLFNNFNYTVSPSCFQSQGEYTINIPLQSVYPGINVILFMVNDKIYTSSFIKQ
ncbi:MAG: hypothetical protein IPO78_13130 [Saprospiraceae bacterium]|nr:hypothetical protein [Saprospiraceae bacterium]MBK9722541.1 hypothetical protein [Saprospiraceae bacterium]